MSAKTLKEDIIDHPPVQLRDYQKDAIAAWKKNNFYGIFEMATGTGKTLTALSCAKYLLNEENRLNLLILVPTLELADQWARETKRVLLKHVIIANSRNSDWYKESLIAVNHADRINYCIIVTYATFLTQRCQSIINKMSPGTLLIADEVHNFGTKKHIDLYPKKIKRRLGLSATPNRYFDEQGTSSIFKYFKSEEGPIFQFDMAKAIQKGYLCEYYYYPVIVQLTNEELEEYKNISRRLWHHFDKKAAKFSDNPKVAFLLLKRKKLIHNAFNKLDALRRILEDLCKTNPKLKYTLVYVPEGNDSRIETEDHKLINRYSKIIAEEFNLSQHQFIGITKGRSKILDQFASGEIAVLTAMKCLDEGIDIKRAEIAIFCASTGNSRQFIQRR
ncbi:MAG: DEAD/DEAH box helicase family protein, partial [Bacteroidia bacterium]